MLQNPSDCKNIYIYLDKKLYIYIILYDSTFLCQRVAVYCICVVIVDLRD